jgi:glycosyltransferase involved in cell wall biosynthesis
VDASEFVGHLEENLVKILGGIDQPSFGSRHLGPTVQVAGWAYSSDGPISSVRVEVNGRSWRAGICRYRPDVAQALGLSSAAASGFEAEIDVSDERAEVSAVAVLTDGRQALLAKVPIQVTHPQRHLPIATAVRRPARFTPPPRKAAERVRLLVVARSLDRGGSQLRMAELVRHLGTDPRFQIEVLSPHEGPLRTDLETYGARVQCGGQVCLSDIHRYEGDVTSLVDWARGRFDVVLGFTMTSFPAIEAAVRLGLPSVLRIGENEPIATVSRWTGNPICPEVEERYWRAMAAASVVVHVSQSSLDTQRAFGTSGACALIHNGVSVPDEPVNHRERLRARADLGLNPNRRLMICAASIWPVKGQSLLAEAFGLVAHAHQDVDLLLIGQCGPEAYLDGIRACANRWGLKERLRIEPMTADTVPWLLASDIAVCASESEAMPTSVLEALAIGLPVVGTCVGDLPLVITEGITGWLSPPCDLAGLARALDRALAADSQKLVAMGRLGQERVRTCYERGDALRKLTDLLATLPTGHLPWWFAFC